MKHGDRVALKGTYNPSIDPPSGTIVGTATIERKAQGEIQFLYMVELENGFYSQDEKVWVSILAVDPAALFPID